MTEQPVPFIASESLLVFLVLAGLLLGLALVLGALCRRIGLPALIGELTVGVVLGPSVLGSAAPGVFSWLRLRNADQLHLLDAVGQLGVLMLVGIIGIQLDLGALRTSGATVARVSLGGLLVPLALGVAVGLAAPASLLAPHGHRGVFALFLGVAICVSAIPVIAKILLELRLMHRDIGQLILSAAAVTDCVGWLLLSVVAALATAGVRAGQIGLSLGYLVGLLLVTWLVGRPTVHGVMRLAERGGNRSSTITATVVLLLLSAAATQAMGLEDIFGAFLCGILIGRTPGFDRARLAPLNTFTMAVLAPIFFATVGLRLDLNALRSTPLLVTGLLILAVAVLGKFSGAYLGARLSKLTHWEGLALGSGLNSRGVVEVVIAQAGLRLGILTTGTYTILVLTAVATTMMAPPLLRRAAGRIAPNPGEFVRQERLRTLEDQPASTVTYG
jgi:Kef-type K+ transport system membrane component KefB